MKSQARLNLNLHPGKPQGCGTRNLSSRYCVADPPVALIEGHAERHDATLPRAWLVLWRGRRGNKREWDQ